MQSCRIMTTINSFAAHAPTTAARLNTQLRPRALAFLGNAMAQTQKALALADMGFAVFPCREQDWSDPETGKVYKAKTPYTAHGFKDASRDHAQIRDWWRRWPDALVGLPTGKQNRIVVLDLDRKDGKDGVGMLKAIGVDASSPATLPTPSGGEHRYFRYPPTQAKVPSGADLLKTLAGRDKTGIDVRGDGGYVIVWGGLDVNALEGLPDWPQEFEAARRRDETEKQAQQEYPRQRRYDGSVDLERIRDALSCIPADDHDTWLAVGMALKAELGDAGESIFDQWSRTAPDKYSARDQKRRWKSFRGRGVTVASLFWHARQNGWRPTGDGSKNSKIEEKAATNGGDTGCDHTGSDQSKERSRTLFAEEPLPLFRELPKGEAFPVDALGPVLGGMAKALHDAAVQSPMAICGTAVLAAAACATQGLRNVQLPISDGQAKPLSLYFLAIAQSGERKTATDREALKPIHTRSEELRRRYAEDFPRYQNALDAWTAERKKILGNKKLDVSARRDKLDALGHKPAEPKSPILIVQEPTLEGLTKHLKVGYPSLGLFSSEGGQFIGGHAMSEETKLRSAAALNALWDDGRLERIRASEETAILPGRRVSVFLQAQPDVAQHFLADPILQEIGLLARFLITQPNSTMGSRRFRELEPEHQAAIASYCAKTLSLLRRSLPYDERGDGLEPPALIMSPDARAQWIELADHVEAMLTPGGELHEISGFANKLAEHAARIAAVLQTFDDPGAGGLNSDYLARGIELAEFYASEALRLHGAARIGIHLKEAERLRVWLAEKWREPYITVRDLQQKGPRSSRDKAQIERQLATLEAHNWVAKESNVTVSERLARVAWAIAGRVS